MPALSLTEQGKLSAWGLIRHYQQNKPWYIQQAKILVTGAKYGVGVTKTVSGSSYVFNQDEVGEMLYLWLMVNPQWLALLKSKPNLPVSQYDFITDAMSRHVAYDAYSQII
jgi:hypothetical protein